MQLAPPRVMMAPGCSKPVLFHTMLSGNTFGAVHWTDGKLEAPMLLDEPWLRKCRSEGILFWSDDCVEISPNGDSDYIWGTDECKDLEYAVEPDESDYKYAIQSEMGTTLEQFQHLRIRLWWKGNDKIRLGKEDQLNEEHMENLLSLTDLLDEGDNSLRIMKAEAYRELSQFSECLSLLDYPFPEEFKYAIARISQLAIERNNLVAEFQRQAESR